MLRINGTPFMWASKLTSTTPLSTAESELLALVDCSKAVQWARGYLADIGFAQTEPTIIYEDNRAAESMAMTGKMSDRNRHFFDKVHYVNDLVVAKVVEIIRVETSLQLADGLTKPLDAKTHELHFFGSGLMA